MKTLAEIQLFTPSGHPIGIGRIWESRPGKWSWAHPNGSQGCDCPSFEAAEAALESVNTAGHDKA